MSKVLIGAIALVVLFFGAVFYMKVTQPEEPQIGTQTADEGRKHIAREESHEPYKSDFPTSGPHYADDQSPTKWGVYEEELPDEILVHNMEHGGIVVTYKPDLASKEIQKLKKLFSTPYSNKDFKPLKAIVIPRTKNKDPITLGAWRYSLNLQIYDEQQLIAFYKQRLGESPEPTGR